MKNKNINLNSAKIGKNDEFYTSLEDIEKELFYYRDQFKGKTILCNCDDPRESNFFIYFALNFNFFGLKKLISTCYDGSPIAGTQMDLFQGMATEPGKTAYKAEITSIPDFSGKGAVGIEEIDHLLQYGNIVSPLEGNGDFRSPECVALLKEADIVVTNPPFSLFREYVNQLMEFNKYFLIIGNLNAVTCKEIFEYIMENKIWFGKTIHSGDREFRVPDDYPLNAATTRIDSEGKKYIRVKGVRWYTNMDVAKNVDEIVLYKKYTPEEYPKYVNYDAIEVSKVCDIPRDYAGEMGVPITFLDKYNPNQFEIKGMDMTVLENAVLSNDIKEHAKDAGCRMRFYLTNPDGSYRQTYRRIVIQNKHPESPEGDKQKT